MQVRRVVWAFVLIANCGMAQGQEIKCQQVSALAKIARAKSAAAINRLKLLAGTSYRVRFVVAYRSFQLSSSSKPSGRNLLNEIPKNDAERTELMTMGDSLCDGEPITDMKTLSRVRDGAARELANAVLVVPDGMTRYVEYALDAIGDVHSDYAVQMKRVCVQQKMTFRNAVEKLPQQRRETFEKYVLKVSTCEPLALPEAD